MMKNKKFFLPSVILIAAVFLIAMYALLSNIAKKPNITEAEFPFSITYEKDGETVVINAVYKAEYEGNGGYADTLHRNYSGTVIGQDEQSTIYTFKLENNSRVELNTFFYPDYMMGDTEYDYFDEYPFEPRFYYYDANEQEFHNEETLAARCTNERMLTGYICHKTGMGHSDFSEPQPLYLDSSNRIRWQKTVCVLTNRSSYSSTNDFVKMMRTLPRVTIVGDRTGGGSGLPFSSELPNGWSVRFSACPSFDVDMQHTEFGIEPDVKVSMSDEDRAKGVDTIIETARTLLGK